MRSGKPRPWVSSHYENGYSCVQSHDELVANIRHVYMDAQARSQCSQSVLDSPYHGA